MKGVIFDLDGVLVSTDEFHYRAWKSVEVKNSFVRAWDDALVVKNYDTNSRNIKFSNVQVWTDLAQSMEIGYETNKGAQEDSTISSISYKNIVVEDAQLGRGDGAPQLKQYLWFRNMIRVKVKAINTLQVWTLQM